VREHLLALGAQVQGWRVVDEPEDEPPIVIEGELRAEHNETAEEDAE
jgi:hypothetical protein